MLKRAAGIITQVKNMYADAANMCMTMNGVAGWTMYPPFAGAADNDNGVNGNDKVYTCKYAPPHTRERNKHMML